jgi:hypothetical protein
LQVLGDLLDASGWTNALVEAGIASSGTADSFIHGTKVSKTRHAHQVIAIFHHSINLFQFISFQVTAAALHKLLDEAWRASKSELTLDEWSKLRSKESAHFCFWYEILCLQTLLLAYVRSLRSGSHDLYVSSLLKLVPWFFALDHTHYARWISVHIRDMQALPHMHPSIHDAFNEGKFVVRKTKNKFSSIALDHCHEQNNAIIKGKQAH